MSYPGYAPMIDKVRDGRIGLRWLAAGLIMVVVVDYILALIWREAVLGVADAMGQPDFAFTLFQGSTPVAMLTLLSSFLLWFPALALTLNVVHRLPFMSVIGETPARHFAIVLRGLLLLNVALIVLPPWESSQELSANLDGATWLALLPFSMVAILTQVSAEEILFRGYLQQHLAARFAHPAVWLIVPSALFALGHYDSANGANAWLIVLWAGLFGVMLADLTARSGSLGPAIAVHFVNNAVSLLLVAVPDRLDGLALYTLPAGYGDAETVRLLLPVDFAIMFISWLAARLALRR